MQSIKQNSYRKIIYLPETAVDFSHIYEHYAYERGVPEVADRIDLAIRNAIHEHLLEFPGIGKPIDHNVRAYLVNDSHWVFYRYDDEHIYVRRIRAAKEVKAWDELDI